MSTLKGFVLGTVFLAASAAALGQVTVPNAFTPGTPAKAAEVNANFTALANGINALQGAALKFDKAWVSGNAYSPNAVVTNAGSTYIAIAAVPAGTTIAPGADTAHWATLVQSGGGLVVRDSTGAPVGQYLWTALLGDSVLIKTGSGVYVLGLTGTGTNSAAGYPVVTIGRPALPILYATTNCTGAAYGSNPSPRSDQQGTTGLFAAPYADGNYYYTSSSTQILNFSYGSALYASGCNTNPGTQAVAYPLTNATLVSSLGVAPFAISPN